ncbi:MAG TPA: CCA tRNA nucleotidyltransferase [Candidatus Eisenbacteria bacterium]|nr:CCA tRNA nucleotidyltransferase [Candidatus Eisenbacteria bacterium]
MSGARPPADPARARASLAAHAWPVPLLAALARLAAGGHRAYLVGGSVRDALLGRPDGARWDVASDLEPAEVQARFARVEPTGLRHGTVLVLEPGAEIECTTFRREAGYRDARHPDAVTFTDDPVADLARRDLTVNAIAFDPLAGELLDPFGGLADLAAGVLRAVGDPLARFREDALRPLRVARLAATLEMEVAPATRAALGQVGGRLAGVSMERVRDELERMLTARRPSRGLELLREAGLLEAWLPELAATVGVPQNRWHAYDVWTHSILSCDEAPENDRSVRWAALLHDLGKPGTRAERDGQATFYGHAALGATLADALLERLRMPRAARERIVTLVREHMFDYRPEWSDAAVRRWLRRVGEDAVEALFELRRADARAHGPERRSPQGLERLAERIARVRAATHARSLRDLAVDGRDVMRVLGLPPGPRVGEMLSALLEEVTEDPAANTREHLLARLAARASGHDPA